MASLILQSVSRKSLLDNTLESSWTRDLTKNEAESLLDTLEAAGFAAPELRCTGEGLFSIHLPDSVAVVEPA
jgi:hypothetical protein